MINKDLDALSSVDEVAKAIKQMSVDKAPRSDTIPEDLIKSGSTWLTKKLTDLFQVHWKKGTFLKAFEDATIVHIHTKKEKKLSCNSYKSISFLSLAGKILARVLLNRLLEHLEQKSYNFR